MALPRRAWARRLAPYVVLGLIAAVPAFYLLGQRGLWGDEVWTVWWSQLFSWRVTFSYFDKPPDLPLPMLLIKAAEVFGRSEFLERLPSALFGVGSVLLLFHIARRRLGLATAIGASVLLAIAPLHVWYEQEARPYAGLEFLALLSLAFFLRLLERPTFVAIAGLAIANALCLYNHLFGAFPWLVELVVAAGLIGARWVGRSAERPDAPTGKRILGALALGSAGTVALLVPILPGLVGYVLQQKSGGPSGVVVDIPFIQKLLAGFSAGYSWAVFLFTALALLGVGAALTRRQPLGLVALTWIVLPIATLVVFAPAHGFVNRYVTFIVPLYLLTVAHGVIVGARLVIAATNRLAVRTRSLAAAKTFMRPGLLAVPAFAVLLALILPITAGAQMASRGTDWSGMCEYLRANARPGDTIIGSDYYQPAMQWCFEQKTGVAVPALGSYSPRDLLAAGRPSWYVHIETTTIDPEVATLGYTEVPREAIERPGTQHSDIQETFPYAITEHGSRLFRGPSVQPVASVVFHDIRGETAAAGWPDHAGMFRGGRYVVTLALPADWPRDLRLEYLAGPDRVTLVRIDGSEVARLAETDVDEWTTATIPLAESSATTVTVELEAAGGRQSAISSAALIARAAVATP
jgi:hypothetical protein